MPAINRNGHFLFIEAKNRFIEAVILRKPPPKIDYFRKRSPYNAHLHKNHFLETSSYKACLCKGRGPIGLRCGPIASMIEIRRVRVSFNHFSSLSHSVPPLPHPTPKPSPERTATVRLLAQVFSPSPPLPPSPVPLSLSLSLTKIYFVLNQTLQILINN
jgi:hypothetical protein